MEFNWLDIALGIPLLYGIVSGLFKGIVQSVGSLIGLVLGIVLAYVYAKPFSQQLIQWFVLTPDQSYAISFVLLFIAVVVMSPDAKKNLSPTAVHSLRFLGHQGFSRSM